VRGDVSRERPGLSQCQKEADRERRQVEAHAAVQGRIGAAHRLAEG
jgi:hypothetical protein